MRRASEPFDDRYWRRRSWTGRATARGIPSQQQVIHVEPSLTSQSRPDAKCALDQGYVDVARAVLGVLSSGRKSWYIERVANILVDLGRFCGSSNVPQSGLGRPLRGEPAPWRLPGNAQTLERRRAPARVHHPGWAPAVLEGGTRAAPAR